MAKSDVLEGHAGLEAEEWTGGPLETPSVLLFFTLSPTGAAERSRLWRLPFSAFP